MITKLLILGGMFLGDFLAFHKKIVGKRVFEGLANTLELLRVSNSAQGGGDFGTIKEMA